MTEPDDQRPGKDDGFQLPPWDVESIMRRRTDEARQKRDAAIQELRESITDEEILDQFGIDLGQIEG